MTIIPYILGSLIRYNHQPTEVLNTAHLRAKTNPSNKSNPLNRATHQCMMPTDMMVNIFWKPQVRCNSFLSTFEYIIAPNAMSEWSIERTMAPYNAL